MPESVNDVASSGLIENDMKNHIRFTTDVNLALLLVLGELVLSLENWRKAPFVIVGVHIRFGAMQKASEPY